MRAPSTVVSLHPLLGRIEMREAANRCRDTFLLTIELADQPQTYQPSISYELLVRRAPLKLELPRAPGRFLRQYVDQVPAYDVFNTRISCEHPCKDIDDTAQEFRPE